MHLNAETIAILILGGAIVILFSLAVIISMWVKTKRKAFAWFLAQIVLLIIDFFMIIGLMKINSDISNGMSAKDNSVVIGIIGGIWTISMLCMLVGIYFLTKERTKDIELNKNKEEYNPSFMKAFGMLAFYSLLCTTIPGIVLTIASKLIGYSTDDPLNYIFTTLAGLGLLLLWLKRKYLINLKSMFSKEKISIIIFIPIVFIIIGLGILLSEISNFTTRVLPMSDFWLKIFSTMAGEGFAPWKGILAVVVIAPIVEEIILRGMVLRGFLKHYSVRKSILLSALLFGLLHMNPWQFISAFAAGIILGYLYEKTNSIITTIFAHALNNSMGFIIGAFGIGIPGYNTAIDIATHQPLWFDFIGIIFFAAGIVWLVKLFSTRKIGTKKVITYAEDSNL